MEDGNFVKRNGAQQHGFVRLDGTDGPAKGLFIGGKRARRFVFTRQGAQGERKVAGA